MRELNCTQNCCVWNNYQITPLRKKKKEHEQPYFALIIITEVGELTGCDTAINSHWFVVAGEDLVSEPSRQGETFARGGTREAEDVSRETTSHGALRLAPRDPDDCWSLPCRNAIASRFDTSPRDHPASHEGMRTLTSERVGTTSWIGETVVDAVRQR